ncbi:MAG: hypothetical protein HQL74_14660 [Magnetococcales bacterium]|nr:hypothetical protein [Magnetococcales bacterium]
MKKNTATIILNRNLPAVTDSLYDSLTRNNGHVTDVFVVEAGSDDDKLSRHCSWHANWEQARKEGLRPPRGFNFGLTKLWEAGKFAQYDYFFLLTNDTEFDNSPYLEILLDELGHHPRVGIISPCSKNWGEWFLLKEQTTLYFWYVLNTALLLRREFIESVMTPDQPDYHNFLYDGTNFRGYGTELELVAKGYANDWATALTRRVWSEENETYLHTQHHLINTEAYHDNLRMAIEEGEQWMRRKYGFKSRWNMQLYSKSFYDLFFRFFPEYRKYRI